jgi:hypothetical protein
LSNGDYYLPEKVPELIRNIFLREFSDPANEQAFVKEIHEKVRLILKDREITLPMPTENWASKERKKWKESNKSPDWLDQPWSLGSLDHSTRPIPLTAVSDVVSLSVLCKMMGTSFTCRQASWAARLLPLLPKQAETNSDTRLEWLRFWSSAYSLEELRSESFNSKTFDSSELDLLIAIDPWVKTHHVDRKGRQVPTKESMTIRVLESAAKIEAPKTWSVAMLSVKGEFTESYNVVSTTSQDRLWIPYMIGEAEQFLNSTLGMSQWRLVAAILESSPLINGDPLGTPDEDTAMELVRKIVNLVSKSQLDEAVAVAKIEMNNRSQIYVQFKK